MTLPLLRTRSTPLVGETAAASLIGLERRSDVILRNDASAVQPLRRSKIWELADTLHCSIIGTCLSTAELRHVLIRLKVSGAETADDHALHVIGVMLAGRHDGGARFLQKALDRRHGLVIKQFGRAKDEPSLRLVWEEAAKRGDIPGAYWAVLSHPVATETLVKQAFQHVHMLSHLVGAANRADIRRLRELEEQNAALIEKVDRQQNQLREGFTSRDLRIRQLNELLARHIVRPDDDVAVGEAGEKDEREALKVLIADLNKKFGQETERRARLERRLNAMTVALTTTNAALRTAERERDAVRNEILQIEDQIMQLLEPESSAAAPVLSGITILYVGGRAHQVPQLKALVERTGARFLHHDGGIEHSSTLLQGFLGRADIVCFPIDCVSHDAVAVIKRLCRQLGKPYQPLRTASLAALMASLATTSFDRGGRVAAE